MKSFTLLLLLPLLGLLAACSGGKDPGRPLAAAFEYGDSTMKPTQVPVFVLYDDGSLIFRKRNGQKLEYQVVDLLDAEQTQLQEDIEAVVGEPGLRDRYELSPDKPSNTGTAFVFFSQSGSTVIQVDDLKAVEVASLRLSEGPDFSGDSSFPNALIQYITSLGMLRVSAAEEWRNPSSDPDRLFPSQERWSQLKFEAAPKRPEQAGTVLTIPAGRGTARSIQSMEPKKLIKPEVEAPGLKP